MAVNVSLKAGSPYSQYQLLVWLNETLHTNFTRVEQVCTGAAFCQLMNRLFPGSFEFDRVRLQNDTAEDRLHNYKLLQGAFKKTGVLKEIPFEALVKKNLVVATTFLQWFKLFFIANSKERQRHTSEALRENIVIPASSGDCSSQNHHHETLSKTNGKKAKEPNQEQLVISDISDAPILISDDEDSDDMVKDEVVETKKRNRMQVECVGAVAEDNGGGAQSPTSLSDTVLVCSHTPYCLYLFEGTEPDTGTRATLVLVGYFDHKSGISVVRLLDSIWTSVGEIARDRDADAQLLIRRLKELGLALKNISVFYCNVPHPESFVLQLRAFSPRLLSLCGFPGMVGNACQAGLTASFSRTVELIRDIHHYYSTSTAVHSSLTALFVNAEDFNPSLPISSQYIFIIPIVQRMVISWRELVDYFKSPYQAKGVEGIRSRLMDAKVKLHFLFLNHALKPLQALHNLQQNGAADVAVELQLTSMLFNSCASSLLRPSAAECFLKRRDLSNLHNKSEQLPVTEVAIGPKAREFLWITPMVDLSEEARQDFMKSAAAFFKSVLLSLVDSIPEQLGDLALRNILTVQKLPDNLNKVKSLRQLLPELGIQLGLICSGSPEADQLKRDCRVFTEYIKRQQAVGASLSWAKMLAITRPQSSLRRLLLTLLALPTSLCRKRLFAQVSAVAGCLPGSKEASDGPGRREERRPGPKPAARKDQKHKNGGRSSALSVTELSDSSDNSSGVIVVTTASTTPAEQSPGSPLDFVQPLSSGSDNEDEVSVVAPPTSTESSVGSEGRIQEAVGELVWGETGSRSLWPAIIMPWGAQSPDPGTWMVEWFGQNTSCQVSTQTLKPFAAFKKHFSTISYSVSPNYRDAIYFSLQEAALRCDKHFSADQDDKEEIIRQMLVWAFGGFEPSGPDGFKPDSALKAATELERRIKARKKLFATGPRYIVSERNVFPSLKQVSICLKRLPLASVEKFSHRARGGKPWRECVKEDWRRGWAKGGGWRRQGTKKGWRASKAARNKSSLLVGPECDISPNYEPNRRPPARTHNKVKQPPGVYIQPDQNIREQTVRRIMGMKLDIEGFCLCCGTENVEIFHPLFKGSLCLKCKNNFTETLYRYDDDGYQSYCTICCYGLEVVLCGNSSCCRSYCDDCLNILVGPGTFESLKLLDPWSCYLCQPHKPHGSLVPRDDWSIRVQQLFANNSGMEFEPHRVYPSIPANLRRPVRVLSLFDGIATGYLVLKDLGFKVERYVASEVCEDSVAVGTVNSNKKIIHIGDVRLVNQEQLEKWGPFDLLIGGSPCNDLSIVNPIRKGLYEGSGRLFFEFYRILQLLKPKEDDPRPFFWLFENVVFMNTHDKVNICRFLECNPVLVDAVRVSPAHRARYFWGNIPGMSRPIIASQSDKLTLQECLEVSREARVSKVRTITTNPNSLKQGKHINLLPVLQDGHEDNLWITELERIFGFPKHYTDVRNMNRQQRQKVLGKAWSVPVIRHLFAPLKDYFAFEEVPTLTAPDTSSDSAAASLSSPASPELQPLQ